MTQYQFLSEIYTPEFMFYSGCAEKAEIIIDIESSTIQENISYNQDDIVDFQSKFEEVLKTENSKKLKINNLKNIKKFTIFNHYKKLYDLISDKD